MPREGERANADTCVEPHAVPLPPGVVAAPAPSPTIATIISMSKEP
jgi:hypothetical protein